MHATPRTPRIGIMIREEKRNGKIKKIYVPSSYAKIGTLTTHLKLKPLVELVLLFQRIIRQKLLRVILLDEVLDTSAGLPEDQVRIRILDSFGRAC